MCAVNIFLRKNRETVNVNGCPVKRKVNISYVTQVVAYSVSSLRIFGDGRVGCPRKHK